MKNYTYLLLIIVFISFSFSENPGFRIYNEKGKKVKYDKMIKELNEADIILFGELHNNPISHWMQLEVSESMLDRKPVFGAEMFEADNQVMLTEYMDGLISAQNFEDQMRLWKNNETDYQPLVELAKENHRPFIATNVPRRYASIVFRSGIQGLDSISDEAKKWMAPLPFEIDMELPGYKSMAEMGMGHGGDNIVQSQALKDATMAYFILQNRSKGEVFIHFNGTYHSNNFEGIYHYLMQADPTLKIMTIASVEQEDVDSLQAENENLSNFILVINESMTKTY
jgi:uncharacterized iron-regulated protein